MIKTATVYRLTSGALKKLRGIDPSEHAAIDPGKTQWGSVGFVQHFNEEWRYGITGGFLFTVQFRDRVLPGKVITTALDARCAEIAERQGNPVSRKQRMQIKDDVIAKLLPTAFIRHTDVPVFVISQPTTNTYFLLIGSSSATKVDEIVWLLRSAVGDTPSDNVDTTRLQIEPFSKGLDIEKFLLTVTCGDALSSFSAGMSTVLQMGKAVVRVKNVELESDAVLNHIKAGFRPAEVHMYFGEPGEETYQIGFALTDKGVIKRIKFADVSLQDVEESSRGDDNEAAYFDGTAALVVGEMREMLRALQREAGVEEEDDEL